MIYKVATSQGPGGQHANRAATKVTVIFDAQESPSLSERQRNLIVERLGSVVRVTDQGSRSQWRNRRSAERALGERLAAALTTKRARHATRPSRSANRRRLESKSRRGEVKRARRRPEID